MYDAVCWRGYDTHYFSMIASDYTHVDVVVKFFAQWGRSAGVDIERFTDSIAAISYDNNVALCCSLPLGKVKVYQGRETAHRPRLAA